MPQDGGSLLDVALHCCKCRVAEIFALGLILGF